MALEHLDGDDLVALALVSTAMTAILDDRTLRHIWSSRVPTHVSRVRFHLAPPPPPAPRKAFQHCRRATLRLRRVVDTAKTEYKIKTGRNGSVDSCPCPAEAPEKMRIWWDDAKAAILDGADVALRDNSGQTLLHWAVCLGDFQVVAALLGVGLDPMARSKPLGPNTPGHRPYDIAISGSRIMNLLIENVNYAGF